MKKIIEYLNDMYAKVALAEGGCLIHDYDFDKSLNFKYPRKTERVDIHSCKVCSKRKYKTLRMD